MGGGTNGDLENYEEVIPIRPSEFATDEEWAQASISDKWEAEDEAGTLRYALKEIEKTLISCKQDLGLTPPVYSSKQIDALIEYLAKELKYLLPEELENEYVIGKLVTQGLGE